MPHTPSHRMQRIADQIQQELAQLLLVKVSDPRFHSVSITAVDVSPDMANATIFVSVFNTENSPEVLKALNNAAGFFRRELAQTLNLRITPRLRFVYDTSIAKGTRLAALINQLPDSPDEETDEHK